MRRFAIVGLALATACTSKPRKAIEVDMRAPDTRAPATPAPAPALELPATSQVGNAVPDGVPTITLAPASIKVGDDSVGPTGDAAVASKATTDALVKLGNPGAVLLRGTPDTPFELVAIAAEGAAGAGHAELVFLALGPGGKPTALPACAPTVIGSCQGEAPSNFMGRHFVLTLSTGGTGQLAAVGGGAPATALTTVNPDAIAAAVQALEGNALRDPTAPVFVHVLAQPGVTLSDLVRALAVPSGTLRIMIGGSTTPPPPIPSIPIEPFLHPTDMPPGVVG